MFYSFNVSWAPCTAMNQQCHLKPFVLWSPPGPSCSREHWQDEVWQARSCFIFITTVSSHTHVQLMTVPKLNSPQIWAFYIYMCLFFCLVLNSFCTLLQRQLHSVITNIYGELIKGFGIPFFFSCLNRRSGSSQLVKCWGRVSCIWFYLHERSRIRLCIFSKISIGQLTAVHLPHASCCWVLKPQTGAAMESQRNCFIKVDK